MIKKIQHIYEEHYKKLMLIPILMLVLFTGVLIFWQVNTGEFVTKDVSLKGGVLITVHTDKSLGIDAAEAHLESELDTSARIKELSSVGTGGRIGYIFELASGADKDAALNEIGGLLDTELTEDDYTVEEISASLGAGFWQSTIKAVLIAFLFMSFVIVLYFGDKIWVKLTAFGLIAAIAALVFVFGSFATYITASLLAVLFMLICLKHATPSFAIIMAAVADFIGVLAIMNLLGIHLSSAGVAALLMLIGYSVDSDVLLSTQVVKRRAGKVIDRVYSALKTGLTMEFTTLAALVVLYVIAPASTLKTIATVLIIGIVLDLPNTWLMNAGILRWHKEKENE